MKHLTLTICLTLAVLLGSLVTGCGSDSDSGADFDKGVAAYESGDYATALREFRPLAEQGHANAQFHMGVTYAEGVGVPKDYKTAMKWFTLAAEQGNASAQVSMRQQISRLAVGLFLALFASQSMAMSEDDKRR